MVDGRRFVSSHIEQCKPNTSKQSEQNSNFPEAPPFDASSAPLSPKIRNTKRAVSSLTESALLVDILKNEGYDVIEAAGAGYKILAVIQGKWEQQSTYKIFYAKIFNTKIKYENENI